MLDDEKVVKRLEKLKEIVPQKLITRLTKLYDYYDFTQAILMNKVAEKKTGTSFGELAGSSVRRTATV